MQDNKISFTVIHGGHEFGCIGYLNRQDRSVIALAMSSQTPRSAPRVVHHTIRGDSEPVQPDYAKCYDELRLKLDLLTDLLHGGLPWRSLLTARRTANLLGAIIHAAEAQRNVLVVSNKTRLPQESSK